MTTNIYQLYPYPSQSQVRFANYFAVQHHDIFSPIIVVRTSVNLQKVCCITVLLNVYNCSYSYRLKRQDRITILTLMNIQTKVYFCFTVSSQSELLCNLVSHTIEKKVSTKFLNVYCIVHLTIYLESTYL